MTECKEYGCEHHGAYECGATNMMIDVDGIINCRGSVECKTCYWMGLDGESRFCTTGDHTSNHYCYFGYKSGWEPKKG